MYPKRLKMILLSLAKLSKKYKIKMMMGRKWAKNKSNLRKAATKMVNK